MTKHFSIWKDVPEENISIKLATEIINLCVKGEHSKSADELMNHVDKFGPLYGYDKELMLSTHLRDLVEAIHGWYPDFPLNDAGNASRLRAVFGHDFKYLSDRDQIYIWRDPVWVLDKKGKLYQYALEIIPQLLLLEALNAPDETHEKRFLKFSVYSGNERKMLSAVRLFLRYVSVEENDFDRSLEKFCALNTAYDLVSDTQLSAQRKDMFSKRMGCDFDPEATCATFVAFLEYAVPDNDTRECLQRWLGYCLTGKVVEQKFLFLYGASGTGKSLLINILLYVFDEMGHVASQTTFMKKESSNNTTFDLSRFPGSRLVAVSETESGIAYNTPLIKTVTGDGKIAARGPQQGFIEWSIKFKLIITSNYKPIIPKGDPAFIRRLILIEFNNKPKEVDMELGEKLKKEMPGILNWMIDGYRMWKSEGLNLSEKILSAVDEYQVEEDLLQLWIDECCTVGENEKSVASTLFDSHQNWLNKRHERLTNSSAFGRDLTAKGFEKVRSGVVTYYGISVKNSQPKLVENYG